MPVTTTHTLRTTPGDLTAGNLRAFLAGVADDAPVVVRTDYPDRPGERGSITLSVNLAGPLTDMPAADTPETVFPRCDRHSEVQHRDGKPPWCNACGWHRGSLGSPAQHYGASAK